MAIKEDHLEEIIKKSFPESHIEINDLAGDDNHFSVTIRSKKFIGLSRIEQHKMVYEALGKKMGNELHALSIKTIGE
tara:strand:- start:1669 stop:1899 length:231 start_codon:yes stop_codon:yes gene_type:complete